MYIILGGTGHVGSAVAEELLRKQQQVMIITHNPGKAADWQKKGASAAVVDVHDSVKLAEIFSKGTRLFLLNPPAPPHTDIEHEERRTVASILKALKNVAIEKIVAESTYGAQPVKPGERLGDLGTLHEMENGLKELGIPHAVIRAAYYMSNWDMSLETVEKERKLYSLFPPHLTFPMVAPKDIGKIAAEFLMDPQLDTSLQYVEGPSVYSPSDVAIAFSKALEKDIEPVEVPPSRWMEFMMKAGYSEKAALSMVGMTRTITGGDAEMPVSPRRGTTTIDEYVAGMVTAMRRDRAMERV